MLKVQLEKIGIYSLFSGLAFPKSTDVLVASRDEGGLHVWIGGSNLDISEEQSGSH